MPRDVDATPVLDGAVVIDALKAELADSSFASACCPRQAPTSGVVRYPFARWFQPYSAHRRYCQLPVSGRNMKHFLQFRLGCHKLPIAAGRQAGVARTNRQCTMLQCWGFG